MLMVMGTIFLLSHQPGENLQLPGFTGSDKLAHLVAYGVLGTSVLFALPDAERQDWKKRWAWVLLVVIGYGISDEFHQAFIPGREPSLYDLLADATGGVVSLLVETYRRARYSPE